MKNNIFFVLILTALLAMSTAWTMNPVGAAESAPASEMGDCSPVVGDPIEVDEEGNPIMDARLYVEYNSTDGDLGIHGYLGTDGWSELCVYNPDGALILAVKPQGELGNTTLASMFFEGREPTLDEFGFEDLKAFAEGQYAVRTLSYDGTSIVGEATFTRNVPAAPVLLYPEMADEEDPMAVSTENLVIQWEEVTESTEGNPVTITSYEVIVTKVDHEDPHGFSRPIYDVHVGPDAASLSVPSDFLEPETLYEVEVLAIEESGNQTITISFIMTE